MYKWHNIITILDIIFLKYSYRIHTPIHAIYPFESYELNNGLLTQEKPAKTKLEKQEKTLKR